MLRFFFIILFISCQTIQKEKKEFNFDDNQPSTHAPTKSDEYNKKVKDIFYNLHLPTKKPQIFENIRASFNKQLLLNQK